MGKFMSNTTDASAGGEGKSKRKEYNGLKFLDRGNADYQSQKKTELWADKKHADKKRAALARIVGGMTASDMRPISGVFDDATAQQPSKKRKQVQTQAKTPAKQQAAARLLPNIEEVEDSSSSSDCSLSDEEVGEGAIMFKDELLQRAWDPAPTVKKAVGQPGAQKTQGKPAKAANKAAREGPAAVGAFMEVPDWDAAQSEGEDVEAGQPLKRGGRMKAVLPEKVTFGDKQRPEVLGALANKADQKKKQVEKEKKTAQDDRCVAWSDVVVYLFWQTDVQTAKHAYR